MDKWTPDKIRELRQSLELTQEKFSVLIGVTDIYVNYLEKGVRTPGKTLQILLNCIEEKEMKKESDSHGKKSKRSL